MKIADDDFKLKDEKKALLVEDEPINQIVSSKYLEKIGFNVSLATNGLEALQKVGNETYDVIFMDLQMPIMDGFESTLKIREFNDEVIIIALTASIIIDEADENQKEGFNYFLEKPINKKEMKKCIQNFFDIENADNLNNTFSKKTTTNNIQQKQKQLLLDELNKLIAMIEKDEYINSSKIEKFVQNLGKNINDLDFLRDLKNTLNSFDKNRSINILERSKEYLNN